MEKVKLLLNKYGLYLIGGVVVLVIGIVIISLFKKDDSVLTPDRDAPPTIENEKDFFGRVQLPLQYYKKYIVTLSSDVKKNVDTYKNKYVGYKVKNVSHSELVTNALDGMKKGSLNYQKVGNFFYTWSDKYNYANYDENTDIFLFSFEDPATVNDLQLLSTNDKDIEDFVAKYLNTYFGSYLQYTKINITKGASTITVKFNRQVNGTPVRIVGQRDPYSNYIEFTNKGQLKSGKILVAEFEEYAKQKYSIISSKDLEKYISAKEYPKEINFVIKDLTALEIYPDYGYESETPPYLMQGSVDVKEVSLVYLYASKQYAVVPGFAMTGDGTVKVENSNRDATFTMFANAINPDDIYIPSEAYFNNLENMGK